MRKLWMLSGGAANGLVNALAPDFAAAGIEIAGTFGAVGLMREKLIEGAPADLLILTKAMIAGLEQSGHVAPGSARDIGMVPTAVAIRRGDPLPLVGSTVLLRSALLEADELFVPDTRQSTAGVHIAGVLAALGIANDMRDKLRAFPNGQAAMAALAVSRTARPIGATQATEILSTPGVTMVRPLPAGQALATVYTAAITVKAAEPALALTAIALLTSEVAALRRARAGFEPA